MKNKLFVVVVMLMGFSAVAYADSFLNLMNVANKMKTMSFGSSTSRYEPAAPAASTETPAVQQDAAPAEATAESVQASYEMFYMDPSISDSQKATMRQLEAQLPQDASPAERAKMLANFKTIVAKHATVVAKAQARAEASGSVFPPEGGGPSAGVLMGSIAEQQAREAMSQKSVSYAVINGSSADSSSDTAVNLAKKAGSLIGALLR